MKVGMRVESIHSGNIGTVESISKDHGVTSVKFDSGAQVVMLTDHLVAVDEIKLGSLVETQDGRQGIVIEVPPSYYAYVSMNDGKGCERYTTDHFPDINKDFGRKPESVLFFNKNTLKLPPTLTKQEAKQAWVDGKEIEILHDNGKWHELHGGYTLACFEHKHSIFRIKPEKKIVINGVEVPAPFEPKVGDRVFYITSQICGGYASFEWQDRFDSPFGVWRTEEDVKQVVAALKVAFSS